MIQTNRWENALRQAITKPEELLTILKLDNNLLEAAKTSAALFPLKVPHSFVARMKPGDRHDPLLLQVLPIEAESFSHPDYVTDPLHEAAFNPVSGLFHKYHGRVLVTFVGTCAINCRYCFRRYFPYSENNPGTLGWDKALHYIAKDSSIQEVILSGGDPLIANDRTLTLFSEKLNQISHIKRLRIHSRIPIVLPERITPDFLKWTMQLQQKPVLVVHCNHPQEINQSVRDAMQSLRNAGVVLLNQTVLLKGVNDSANTLIELSETLFDAGIQPYYLHLLDKVDGAAHFDLNVQTAKTLYAEIEQHLSGYLVPKLVYEKAGAPSKVSVSSLIIK